MTPYLTESPMAQGFENAYVGGRRVRYIRRGSGAPAVVIDQGYGQPIEPGFAAPVASGWTKVFTSICEITRVVMHDRAGLGASDAAPAPRACREMIEDLRGVLAAAEAEPPYVLVGHSLGGFNVRVHAGAYPEEVAGIVLVDSSHPDQHARLARTLPRESRDEPVALRVLRRAREMVLFDGVDFHACAEQAGAVTSFGSTPLVVVSQSPHAAPPPGMPIEVWQAMRAEWSRMQAELLTLSTSSTQIMATYAGHNVQLEEPRVVVDAILRAVGEARAAGGRLH